MPAVEVREICKCFGDTVAVQNVSFAVDEGKSLCLFGPSGCGKTTTLRLIAGLDRPDYGTVMRDGTLVNDARRTVPPRPGAIGMVFQDLALWPHMPAERHVDFVLRGVGLARADRHGRVRRVLETCRLDDRRCAFPAEMSGGEQQRLAIARAIAADPPLLLLDEPFANLDDALRDHFLAEFKRRKQEGATILFTTHDREEAEILADATLVMALRQPRTGNRMDSFPPNVE